MKARSNAFIETEIGSRCVLVLRLEFSESAFYSHEVCRDYL